MRRGSAFGLQTGCCVRPRSHRTKGWSMGSHRMTHPRRGSTPITAAHWRRLLSAGPVPAVDGVDFLEDLARGSLARLLGEFGAAAPLAKRSLEAKKNFPAETGEASASRFRSEALPRVRARGRPASDGYIFGAICHREGSGHHDPGRRQHGCGVTAPKLAFAPSEIRDQCSPSTRQSRSFVNWIHPVLIVDQAVLPGWHLAQALQGGATRCRGRQEPRQHHRPGIFCSKKASMVRPSLETRTSWRMIKDEQFMRDNCSAPHHARFRTGSSTDGSYEDRRCARLPPKTSITGVQHSLRQNHGSHLCPSACLANGVNIYRQF